MRLVTLLPVLVYGLSSVPGNDGIELPVPISDVMKRLDDLEKRLLVQEQKNVDLEKRLVDQERLNKVQMEIIRELSTCACKSKGKETTVSGYDRNNSRVSPYFRDFKSARTDEGFPANTRISESQTKGRLPLSSFKQPIGERSIGQSYLGHSDATSKSKRVSTGPVAFYSSISHTDMHPKPNQTIVFDHVVTDSGGNFDLKTGTFRSTGDGVYVFSWTVYCSNEDYLITELVVNRRSVGAMLCSGQGADNLRHTTGVAVVALERDDSVFVRTHPTAVLNGVIWSAPTYISSFSGWQIF